MTDVTLKLSLNGKEKKVLKSFLLVVLLVLIMVLVSFTNQLLQKEQEISLLFDNNANVSTKKLPTQYVALRNKNKSKKLIL